MSAQKFQLRFLLFSVAIACSFSQMYFNRNSYYIWVKNCRNHRSLFKYTESKDDGCCLKTARSGELPDRNCCYGFDDGKCYCWPQSQCFRGPVPSIPTSTGMPTTNPTTQLTTNPTTEPTTGPTTEPTTEPTTYPTTEPTTMPTTEVTTTATTITTTPFMSLCDPMLTLTSRLLNSRPVLDDCAYQGIANITLPGRNRTEVVRCHAVLTKATIDGRKQRAFVTSQLCTDLAELAGANSIAISVKIGSKAYPLRDVLFDFLKLNDSDAAFIKPKELYQSLLDNLGPCQQSVCAFNNDTMPALDTFTDCKVVSYGAVDAFTYVQNGLNEVDVEFSPGKCNGDATKLCMISKSGLRSICDDLAAPVYCKAPTNGEQIFIGNVGVHDCFSNEPAFEVIPFPG